MSKTNKFHWDKIDANCCPKLSEDWLIKSYVEWNKIDANCCQKLKKDYLAKLQDKIDWSKKLLKEPRRCCVCGNVEEYVEPDKEGKVYCYKHCSW